jgi:hypothetical protein
MPEFIELARQYNPKGKLRNASLKRNIFGQDP